MGSKRLIALASVVCLHAAAVPCHAEDPPAEEPEQPRKTEFALYVEAGWGLSDARDISTSIDTTTSDVSTAVFALDENPYGRAIVGWRLPEDKGSFRLRFEGFKENDWSLTAVGGQARVAGQSALATAPVAWWTVEAGPGQAVASRTTPMWNAATDDFIDNDKPDPEEVRYAVDGEGNPIPDLVIQGPAPEDLQNRLQAVDVYYVRGFGGRRTRAEWTAGLRYFVYEGHAPAAAWLNLEFPGVGFTDGGALPLLTFRQDASGMGPTFSIELQEGFLRDRIELFGTARGALLFETVETDSGRFFTLVRDTASNILMPVEANLTENLDKNAWQLGMELGVRFRLVEGFHLGLTWMIHSYQDLVLLPSRIAIPQNPAQAGVGTDGVFGTQDIVYEGWFAGLSYQF